MFLLRPWGRLCVWHVKSVELGSSHQGQAEISGRRTHDSTRTRSRTGNVVLPGPVRQICCRLIIYTSQGRINSRSTGTVIGRNFRPIVHQRLGTRTRAPPNGRDLNCHSTHRIDTQIRDFLTDRLGRVTTPCRNPDTQKAQTEKRHCSRLRNLLKVCPTSCVNR